jgi:hypothetical protein
MNKKSKETPKIIEGEQVNFNKIQTLMDLIGKEAQRQQMHPLDIFFALEIIKLSIQEIFEIDELQMILTTGQAKKWYAEVLKKETEDKEYETTKMY